MTREVTIALLDEIQDGFNRQDVDAILSHFVEDCVWVMARGPAAPEGRVCHGKEEIGEVLRTRYGQIPDMRWEDIRHWIFGQEKALSDWVVRGTPAGGRPSPTSAATSGSSGTASSPRKTPTGSTSVRHQARRKSVMSVRTGALSRRGLESARRSPACPMSG